VGHKPASLVGQWGVRCWSWYAAGTVLGEYEGRFYLCNSGMAPNNDYSLGGVTLDERALRFTIDPTQGGNGVLEFMNDFRHDVMRPTDLGVNNPQLANAAWASVQRGREPHMIVVATRSIRPGDWVCIDYSDNYWTSRLRRRFPSSF
jgi:hypothetical protein